VGRGEEAAVVDVQEAALVIDPIWWGTHLRELRWQAELARLLADPVWRGHGLPRGDGGPVLLIPGFLAGDQSLSVLATFLRRIGHAPRRAGIPSTCAARISRSTGWSRCCSTPTCAAAARSP